MLAAWSDGASLHVSEREPGGTFAAPVRLGDADERIGFAAGVTAVASVILAAIYLGSGIVERRVTHRWIPGGGRSASVIWRPSGPTTAWPSSAWLSMDCSLFCSFCAGTLRAGV